MAALRAARFVKLITVGHRQFWAFSGMTPGT
jgi:hypothetical protein